MFSLVVPVDLLYLFWGGVEPLNRRCCAVDLYKRIEGVRARDVRTGPPLISPSAHPRAAPSTREERILHGPLKSCIFDQPLVLP